MTIHHIQKILQQQRANLARFLGVELHTYKIVFRGYGRKVLDIVA